MFHLRQFLEALRIAVPGSARVMGALPALEAVIRVEGIEEPLTRFYAQISAPADPKRPKGKTWADLLLARDVEAILKAPPKALEILDDLDVRAWWPAMTPEDQATTLDHLGQLCMLGQAIMCLDPGIVEIACGVAEDIADGINLTNAGGGNGGPPPALDEQSIMAQVQKQMGALFGRGASPP